MRYRQQGDVLLKAISVPTVAEKIKHERVLQHGEATGHSHKLTNDDYEMYVVNGERYLRMIAPAIIEHEEHGSFEVPVGDWKIEIVREYDHWEEEAREVLD